MADFEWNGKDKRKISGEISRIKLKIDRKQKIAAEMCKKTKKPVSKSLAKPYCVDPTST